MDHIDIFLVVVVEVDKVAVEQVDMVEVVMVYLLEVDLQCLEMLIQVVVVEDHGLVDR